MVDTYKIAIADLLRHPRLGIISHQPDPREPITDQIRVRDSRSALHYVWASECTDDISEEEHREYWKNFPEEDT